MLCLIRFSFMPKSALVGTGSQGTPKLFLGSSGEVRTLVVRTACFHTPSPHPVGRPMTALQLEKANVSLPISRWDS